MTNLSFSSSLPSEEEKEREANPGTTNHMENTNG